MPTFRNLNGQGATIELQDQDRALVTTSDVTLNHGGYVRVGVAGNVVYRPPGSSTDITIPATAGEYIPVSPGTVIRSTTAATGLIAVRS